MTVNEIILAWECCDRPYSICRGCPLYNKEHCRDMLKLDIIDKLKRQQAENDRLNHIRAELSREVDHWREVTKMVKTEAIKEFAEELKRRLIAGGIFPVLVKNEIGNLVKEMTEGKQDAVQNTTGGED